MKKMEADARRAAHMDMIANFVPKNIAHAVELKIQEGDRINAVGANGGDSNNGDDNNGHHHNDNAGDNDNNENIAMMTMTPMRTMADDYQG